MGKSVEKLLEEALVPAEEQPYKVPANWVWVRLGQAVTIKRGASPRPIKDYITEKEDGINWIKIGDTGDGKYVYSVKEKITNEGAQRSVFVNRGTLLLSNSMSFGRPYILAVDGCIHDGWLAITVFDCFEKDYMYYALLASEWYFDQVAVGTAVRNLNSARVSGMPCPLPPLKEQQRIVSAIESLFAKLDKAKELLAEVRAEFEHRKASILAKAFRGELTAKWREENGYLENAETLLQKINKKNVLEVTDKPFPVPGTWIWTPFETIADIQSNLVNPKDYLDYPHVAPDNIEKGTGRLLDYNTVGEDAVISPKHLFHPGQILYSKIRPYLSKLVLINFQGLCSADMYPINARIETKYLFNYMLSSTFLDFASNSGSRSVLPKINQKELAVIPVPLPPLSEQREIVRILDKLLVDEAKIEELTQLEDQIETMKKAILAKAFRGELGTNDPSEESAMELLKQVLKEKAG